MQFNPDETKQAQEIVFSQKKYYFIDLSLYFNIARIQQQSVEKHLAVFLGEMLSFLEHNDMTKKEDNNRG